MAFHEFGQGETFETWSRRVEQIMDEMLRRSFVQFRDVGPWQPHTNVYETRTHYYICVELAGVDRSTIDVVCTPPANVRIRGARAQPRPAGVGGPLSVYLLEIDEGPFQREFDLPEPIDIDRVDARYGRGLLWITMPKKSRT